MKKYKEYMDRIGLSEEKHQQILDALAREDEGQAREDLPAAQTDSLPSVKALPWYKTPSVLRWGGMAAVCCILLLVGISAVMRNNRIDLPVTTAAVNSLSNTTLAVNATLTPTLAPTLAPEASMAPSLTPTMAPASEDAGIIPMYLCDPQGGEEPLLREDVLTIGNLLYKARFIAASGGYAETTTGMNVDEYLNSLTVEDFFEEAIPGQIGPQDDILLKIRTRYYRFVPEKADAAAIAQWESLLEKYGLTLGGNR